MYSKKIFGFLVIYILFDFSQGQIHQVPFREDYTYIAAEESYYKIHSTEKSWRDAKRVCAQEKASLYYPENLDEAYSVLSFWTLHHNNTEPGATWIYLGISDIITEGEFETIDGKSISEVYNIWKPKQPDNSGDEDCVHMKLQQGYLNDISCGSRYSFICKKRLQSQEQNCSNNIQQPNLDEQRKIRNETFFRKDYATTTTNYHYTYIESESSFYKVHPTAQSFSDAKRMCALEGASLFYAENEDEANAVISFWNRTQPNIPWVFVGLSDLMTEGLFETVDQRPITEVYSRWQKFQPDNTGGMEHCVHMDLQGTMNDYLCDPKSYFICKKSLQSLQWNYDCNMPNLDEQKKIRNGTIFLKDYTYIESESSFYKVHTTAQSFSDAKRMCALEGTSLFYAENEDEANSVISFWNRTQPNIPWVFVGLSDLMAEGLFETVDQRPITEVYSRWQKFQPDNTGGKEHCVHMDLQGTMNDYLCDPKSYFICKKSLESLQWNYDCNVPNSDEQRKIRNEMFFRKDYTYIESESSFYKVHTTAQSFSDAKRMCALEGASLFYAENEDEANSVISFWNRTQPYIPWVFVGLSDLMAEGLFETVDQRPITEVYSRWQKFQPDNTGGKEHCVHMDLQGTMNDYLCDPKSYFICKKSLQSLQWNYDCNMPNSDYTFNNHTSKCYKLHTTPLNWTEAYAMCRIEYTSLAVISNRLEADYLASLTKSLRNSPKLSNDEQYQRGIYHLGFHNRFNEGWQTVGGTSMNVDFDVWFDNQQPDGNHFEECGSMFFNGRLINTDCNMKSMFICEHEGDSSKYIVHKVY